MHDDIFYYEPKCVLRAYDRITTVVNTPNSYYVFTTIDGINMPRFAPICHFRYIFNNLHGKSKPRKSCQNTANQSISGGKNKHDFATFCVPRQHSG